jgi:hypothetical protein
MTVGLTGTRPEFSPELAWGLACMHGQNDGEQKRSRKDSSISAFLEQIKKRVSFRREWGKLKE